MKILRLEIKKFSYTTSSLIYYINFEHTSLKRNLLSKRFNLKIDH